MLDSTPCPFQTGFQVRLPILDLVGQIADEALQDEIIWEGASNRPYLHLNALDALLDRLVLVVDLDKSAAKVFLGLLVLISMLINLIYLLFELFLQLAKGLYPPCEYVIDAIEVSTVLSREITHKLCEVIHLDVFSTRIILHSTHRLYP